MGYSISKSIKAWLAIVSATIVLAVVGTRLATGAVAITRPTTSLLSLKHDAQNPNLILFARGALDTAQRTDLDTASADAALNDQLSIQGVDHSRTLRVVQFAGPIKPRWLAALKTTGSQIVGYLPNNAYLIRGTASEVATVASYHGGAYVDENHPIRWMGKLDSIQKIDRALDPALGPGNDQGVSVEFEVLNTADSAKAIDRIREASLSENRASRSFLKFVVISVTVPANRILELADLDEVLFIGPAFSPRLHDERSAQIVASNLTQDHKAPVGPGYSAWLASKGLNTPGSFLVDFTDSGLDRGSTSATMVHPDFRDVQGNSRVAYSINYGRDSADDRRGHGSLVTSVACGSGLSGNFDEAGYLYGLGVDPFTRFGVSRIFAENGSLPFNLEFSDVVSAAYAAGARISNNSWGNGGGSYDIAAQEYDALARDAQPSVPGNQQIFFVFSAGNSGPGGHISSPGTAKNVLTVGASENFRPDGWDSCNLDGMGSIGPDGADNALEILRYSSGGPTLDGRAKPDIIAPGTHVFGCASQADLFNANGLCPGIPIYQPPGQRLYTWSSGTSLAAPHLSGAASLLTRFIVQRNLLGENRPPSPALLKALLTNSASYLTSESAAGNLPNERQGWGLLDLASALETDNRLLIDQSKIFHESGESFEIRGSLADRNLPLLVTLTWTDAPGMLAGPALANDLDLEVIVGDTTVYRGNAFSGQFSAAAGDPDRLNNVESVRIPPDAIPAGAQGNFRVIVRAANISSDGVPGNGVDLDQDFALVVSNITSVVVEPPPPPPIRVPVIASATYVKKRLTIEGHDFSGGARVEINGKIIDREFTFDSVANSLTIKLKRRKLNLNDSGDNQIVLIENDRRSEPFVLTL